jgi:hypothetical protein
LIFADTTKIEAAPRFAIFEAWAPRTVGIRAWLKALRLSCGIQAAVEANEQEVEVCGAHLPKIAEGGAA